jgi:steroid Delta-isomerase
MSAAAVDRIVALFESFTEADVLRLGDYYAPGAFFKDPFNEVHGLDAITRVYCHMFRSVDRPHFVVTRRMHQDDECWLVWQFHFRLHGRGGQPVVVHGASHLMLDGDGRIRSHRDYWDAAEEFYEKLPVLGALMRWLKRRAAA